MARRLFVGTGVVLVAVAVAGAGYLYLAPPELLRVGGGYAAKIVCSNVFIAGRDGEQVLADDVQAPGNPLLKLIHIGVDQDSESVSANFLGFIAERVAVHRSGYGCTVVDRAQQPNPDLPEVPSIKAGDPTVEWPQGEGVSGYKRDDIQALLNNAELTGPGMRGIVVVHDGRIVAEAYGDGFTTETPLLGWSMTKTATGALLGFAAQQGSLSFDDTSLFPEWEGDERKDITLASLAAMQSGLQFNEDYGDVSDVTRMLYLEGNMADFVIGMPATAPPDEVFSYSSGTTVALSRYWQSKMGSPEAALRYPAEQLFRPLGMASAILELDEAGTYVGSSYLYATARDWARFGLFLLQGGEWNGQVLLDPQYVEMMRTPSSASNGEYSQLQSWFSGPGDEDNIASGVPEDAFWMRGHDGQTVTMIPSKGLVVVRMGLTPSRLRYRPQELVSEIVKLL